MRGPMHSTELGAQQQWVLSTGHLPLLPLPASPFSLLPPAPPLPRPLRLLIFLIKGKDKYGRILTLDSPCSVLHMLRWGPQNHVQGWEPTFVLSIQRPKDGTAGILEACQGGFKSLSAV